MIVNRMSPYTWAKYVASSIHLVLTLSSAYNLDANGAKLYEDPSAGVDGSQSYFGYSVAMYASGKESLLLVGAPRANSSRLAGAAGIVEPGVVYKCPIGESAVADRCDEWLLDPTVDGRIFDTRWDIRQLRDHSWLGATVAVADSNVPKVAVLINI